jgi:flagellar biogenesis protein FliO
MERIQARPFGPQPSSLFSRFHAAMISVFSSVKFTRRERLLHLRETLPLGEKRLLAVVEFQSQRFLIGVTGQSIQLLQQLDSAAPQPASEAVFAKTAFEGPAQKC